MSVSCLCPCQAADEAFLTYKLTGIKLLEHCRTGAQDLKTGDKCQSELSNNNDYIIEWGNAQLQYHTRGCLVVTKKFRRVVLKCYSYVRKQLWLIILTHRKMLTWIG